MVPGPGLPGTNPSGPGLSAAVPILPVRNLGRAVAFYGQLGFAAQPGSTSEYAILLCDRSELHLRLAADLSPADAESPSGIYFPLTPGTAAPLERGFREASIPILSALSPRPWGMREFVMADPDGNLLRFGESL